MADQGWVEPGRVRWVLVALLAALAVAGATAALDAPTDEATTAEEPVVSTPGVGDQPASAAGQSALAAREAYNRTITRENATVVVTSAAELTDALANASAGDVVYVPGNVTLNLTTHVPIWVPGGVTLGSDRGVNGSDGALLYSELGRSGLPLVVAGGNDTRISGLRLKGYGGAWTPASRDRPSAWGIFVPTRAANVEIDNNRILQFVGICIQASGNGTYVHHNDIQFCNQIGLGYGVNVGQQAIVECNYIDHTRHAVAAHGGPSNAYVARYNVIGRHVQNHVFDMHEPGGAWVEIHHNTVMAVYSYGREKIDVPSVSVGVPSGMVRIHHNWFFQNASLAIWQNGTHGPPYNESKYENLTASNNAYGTEPPIRAIGALDAHRSPDGRCA
jgi:hypothetical protein